MNLKDIPFDQKQELMQLCLHCSDKQAIKCHKKYPNSLLDCICFKKKLALKIAECEYKRRLKKGEIK